VLTRASAGVSHEGRTTSSSFPDVTLWKCKRETQTGSRSASPCACRQQEPSMLDSGHTVDPASSQENYCHADNRDAGPAPGSQAADPRRSSARAFGIKGASRPIQWPPWKMDGMDTRSSSVARSVSGCSSFAGTPPHAQPGGASGPPRAQSARGEHQSTQSLPGLYWLLRISVRKMLHRGRYHVLFHSSDPSSRERYGCSLCCLLLCFGTDILSSQYSPLMPGVIVKRTPLQVVQRR
jgi:hypothetical protein